MCDVACRIGITEESNPPMTKQTQEVRGRSVTKDEVRQENEMHTKIYVRSQSILILLNDDSKMLETLGENKLYTTSKHRDMNKTEVIRRVKSKR